VVLLDIVSVIYCIFQAFISCTGSQSVSYVLLWQPSDCVYLINDYVMMFSENKYDDDDYDAQDDRVAVRGAGE